MIEDPLYTAACNADAAFSKALRETYGFDGSDMRYQPGKQSPAVRTLRDAYVTAWKAWQERGATS